jgi:phosphopantetheinyl transferase (holo-ACP synthase)
MTRSTGNDIVALDTIDRMRTQQPRFYSKILTVGEQECFCRRDDLGLSFEEFVWLSWSVKESAYKYLKRRQPALVFFPTKCIVEQILPDGAVGAYRGIALWGSQMLYFRSVIHPGYLFTVVSDDEGFSNHYWASARIDHAGHAAQSGAVRELVIKQLDTLYPGLSWRIVKDQAGCPVAFVEGTKTEIPVSLSHHGRYIAYSFVADSPAAASAGTLAVI